LPVLFSRFLSFDKHTSIKRPLHDTRPTVERPLRIAGADPNRAFKPAEIKKLKETGRGAYLAAMFSAEYFGEEISYTPAGGATVTGIFALIDRAGQSDSIKNGVLYWGLPVARNYRANFGGGGKMATAVVWVLKTDIASPAYGDTIFFDGET
jgi:hypothetical protein